MAHTLHLQVVTEGVETQAQFELLLKHDCDFVQGYLLSPAVAASDIIGVIQSINMRNPLYPHSVVGAKDNSSPKETSSSRGGSKSIIRPIR